MNDIDTAILATDPVNLIYQKEYAHIFLCFCAFVNIMENKKTNLPNIFYNKTQKLTNCEMNYSCEEAMIFPSFDRDLKEKSEKFKINKKNCDSN